MSRKSWVEEQVKVYADRCWNEDMPLDDGMLALVTKTIMECARRVRDEGALPHQYGMTADDFTRAILAILEPGDEGGE